MDKNQLVHDVPLVDQTTYSGYLPEAGRYLCSAACLTMVLQFFLGNEKVEYEEIADALIDGGYLDKRGLLSGDYLERFICQNLGKYALIANYSDKQFDAQHLVNQIKTGKLVAANVPNHYTLITGYRVGAAGILEFHINDPFRDHWSPEAKNAVLKNEWLSAEELQTIWEGRHTVFSPDFLRISYVICFIKRVIRRVRR